MGVWADSLHLKKVFWKRIINLAQTMKRVTLLVTIVSKHDYRHYYYYYYYG